MHPIRTLESLLSSDLNRVRNGDFVSCVEVLELVEEELVINVRIFSRLQCSV